MAKALSLNGKGFLFMGTHKTVEKSFYLNGHVTEIAKRLLGKIVWTNVDGRISAGKIVEVEAYSGTDDRACHANNGRRTNRNEVMYAEGGMAYVYLCYGIHSMFNVVTNIQDKADAVLIRAIEPYEGLANMLERKPSLTGFRVGSGPGNVCKALGIQVLYNGAELGKNRIWITDGEDVAIADIVASTRIGVEYANEDALFPWRYYIRNNPSVSKK